MSDIERTNEPGDVTIETKDVDSEYEGERHRSGKLDEIASSVRGFAQRLPDSINRAIESAQSALSNRLNAITVHVDDESQREIDQLVDAGIFKNRSESAAFLISEGLRTRRDLFDAIGSRIAEIERLRTEMRALVGNRPTHEDGPE
jgi:Arc/MetJ-type ribon-helix-helix transcriptional regulator